MSQPSARGIGATGDFPVCALRLAAIPHGIFFPRLPLDGRFDELDRPGYLFNRVLLLLPLVLMETWQWKSNNLLVPLTAPAWMRHGLQGLLLLAILFFWEKNSVPFIYFQLAPSWQTGCLALKAAVPPTAKLVIGITPVPASFAHPAGFLFRQHHPS